MTAFDNPEEFIARMKEFVLKKGAECEEMAHTLSKHSEAPKQVREKSVLGVVKLSETLDRLNLFVDEDDETALLLLTESPEKKASRLQPLGEKDGKLFSSHSLRTKLQGFISKEYEQLLKFVSSLKNVYLARKKEEQSQTQILITFVLGELVKIEMSLMFLEGAIDALEELVRDSHKSSEIRKRISVVNALKDAVYCNYKESVVRPIQGCKELTIFVNQNSSIIIEERHQEQSDVESLSRNLDTSPKAGPSTVSQGNTIEASTPSGTPKRSKKRSIFSKKKKSNDQD